MTSTIDANSGQELLNTMLRNQIRWSRAADMMQRRLDQARMTALVLSPSGNRRRHADRTCRSGQRIGITQVDWLEIHAGTNYPDDLGEPRDLPGDIPNATT